MKLFIDTVNEDLFLSIIKDNQTISYVHLKKHLKKSEILPQVYKDLIKKANVFTKDIKKIYLVNGPGSFMSIRAGSVFAKTLCLILKIDLFSIDNLTFISKGIDGNYYVDAKSKKSFIGNVKNGQTKITLGDFKENSLIDYKTLIDQPEVYLKLFKKVKNVLDFKENYFKEPQIGGI